MNRVKSGLIVEEPWIGLILEGKKTWEIRGTNTRKRERIYLLKKGSKCIVGEACLVDSRRLSIDDFINNLGCHYNEFKGQSMPYKKTWAWVLTNIIKYDEPVAYSHPNGAQIWVSFH